MKKLYSKIIALLLILSLTYAVYYFIQREKSNHVIKKRVLLANTLVCNDEKKLSKAYKENWCEEISRQILNKSDSLVIEISYISMGQSFKIKVDDNTLAFDPNFDEEFDEKIVLSETELKSILELFKNNEVFNISDQAIEFKYYANSDFKTREYWGIDSIELLIRFQTKKYEHRIYQQFGIVYQTPDLPSDVFNFIEYRLLCKFAEETYKLLNDLKAKKER